MAQDNTKTLSKVNTKKATAHTSKSSAPFSTGKCPYCGQQIAPDYEFCPHCHKKLVSYCTFCGAPMANGEDICPDCGQPAAGIVCPTCGTLNHRAFCSTCNTPLTKVAIKAVEKAKKDPNFIKCQELCKKAIELEETLGGALDGHQNELTEGAKEFLSLLNHGKMSGGHTQLDPKDIDDKKQEYDSLIHDINALFEAMLPPVGSTPQEQRNYYSARKVAVTKTIRTKTRVGWICNWCGYTHSNPSECARPLLGGRWIYGESEKHVTEYKYEE